MDETVTKVSGTYHGVAFTGVVKCFDVGFVYITLDAPITVHGMVREGLLGVDSHSYRANCKETK